ncbi:disulfide bond formation protein B [Halopseudomonas laoshanensis]|uniref:Disulfide bond formation protein B n=2 Tax=Halopseudomonas TaxID=2901189 RepID=A0A7V7GVD2_9GAMM|nr:MULTISPECIES: disulfide bond formation protein B [Halopseudomonas]KAA0695270.1 disulfide bond formation protein B [Halopseudomonas laoshanensis]PCC98764.1 disulfide bond formation protein B [Halopseudomonas pelagia]QFY58397.1 disulfide bond formation protein B [Halopseudomonas pelagia]WOD11811.1 disulfide bond formation protein B [Pseudomonas sp. NyZ704]
MSSKESIRDANRWGLLLAAWLLAVAATLAALFIGEVMGKTPCVLCWFQRIFMFPLAVMLTIACYRADFTVWLYALPLTVIGWGFALYHSLVFVGVIPEALKPCSAGTSCSGADMLIFGSVPLPLLSLAVFTAIVLLLAMIRRRALV